MLTHAIPRVRTSLQCALLAAAGIVAAGTGSARAADAGDTGANFLKIGVGARAAAMGEAFVAVAQDPTSTYWNPSGLASIPGTQLHATHLEWISDVRYEYVAAVHGQRGHAWAGHIGLLHMGTLDGRDANGIFTETFRAYDLVAGVSYARRMVRPIELGVTGKVIYEKIGDYDALGFAGDAGIRYRASFLRGLTLAATLTNVGTKMKFVDQSYVLPFAVRMGGAYRTRKVLEGFILAADLSFPNDSDTKGFVGGELWVHEMIALRGGAKLGFDEQLGSLGVGIKYLTFLFDYAYAPFSDSSELGDTHRISIGWNAPMQSSRGPQPQGS